MPDREKVIKGLENLSEWLFQQYRVVYDGDAPNYYDAYKTVDDALALLKEQESEWLEDSDPGQEYGTTWACRKCGYSIHKLSIWNPYEFGYKYCLHCGRKMEVNLDAETSA